MYLKKISNRSKQISQTIYIEGIEITIIRKKIKTLRLSVYPVDRSVRISSPLKASDRYIEDFLFSKIDWIKAQQKKVLLRERPSVFQYLSGEFHSYQGNLYKLELRYEEKKPFVFLENEFLILTVRPGSKIEKRKQILNNWYRSYLKEQIPLLIEKWAPVVGAVPLDWGVKNMKTRWGSCNTIAKRIWLSLKLAEKSIICLEYVVVHEMVHLLEKGHGKAFKAHMDRVLPDWRSLKGKLNKFSIHNDSI